MSGNFYEIGSPRISPRPQPLMLTRVELHISNCRAFEHVFGYTVLNDVSARDLQKRHQQFFLAKSCDGFCPMGPWVVPAAELDPQRTPLRIRTWVNGEQRQDGTTDLMIWDIPALIEVVSKCVPLQPGDVLATGTPAGVGCAPPPLPLHPPHQCTCTLASPRWRPLCCCRDGSPAAAACWRR